MKPSKSKKYYNDINLIKSYVNDLCGEEYSVIGGNPIDGRSKIEMLHNKCGHKWLVETRSFVYNGRRCPNCFGTKKQSIDDIINRCKDLHDDEYKILNFNNYTNNKSKIEVIHNKCGHIYDVVVQNFLNGTKCAKCSGSLKLTKDEVIKRFNFIYGDDYKPILDEEPKNGKTKIKVIHKNCGNLWMASISNILYNNTACPFCKMSKGEKSIKKYLDLKKIEYKIEYRFDDCRYIRPLPFDFFLPEYNICIEYDGIQHFEPISFFGGDFSLIRNKKIDLIKSTFCSKHDIRLIRINYKDKLKINDILDEFFKKI